MLAECQQVGQAREGATVLQEVVLEELKRRSSAADVDAEANGKESLQLLAQLLGFLESRSAICSNQIEGLQGLLVEVGGLRLDHLNRHDTKRPDIDFRTIFLLLDNLRRHPVGCADHCSTLRLGFGELGAEPEIGCL